MPKQQTIITICGDPGGTNAVVPVIKHLRVGAKEKIYNFAYGNAITIFKKNQIPCIPLAETSSLLDIQVLFREYQPSALITGTSMNATNLEKKFLTIAKALAVPSISILDFWANYSLRFSDTPGDLKFIPDVIAVMDELAYKEMVTEGFSPDNLIITGQPAFDGIAEYKKRSKHRSFREIRQKYCVRENDLFVVFVSQPLSRFYGKDRTYPGFLGYTEKTVLNDLVRALDVISDGSSEDIVLLIRPHPKEKIADYDMNKSSNIRIIIADQDDPRDLILASDLVAGMNTELLVEACYLGSIVISIQPGLMMRDVLPTNRGGYSIPIYSHKELLDVTRSALMDPDIRSKMKNKLKHFKHDGHATERVVKAFHQLMKKH